LVWKKALRLEPGAPRRWLARIAEAHILFPAIAVLVLGIVWTTTLNLLSIERSNAERAAAASALELADTYEAQVLRSLREIDQTLKLVKYACESAGTPFALQDLKQKALLPPDLIFAITIRNKRGETVVTTGSVRSTRTDITKQLAASEPDALLIGRPHDAGTEAESKLEFSRRLSTPGGDLAGAVTLDVDDRYFVSGYERAKLGERGVLGLVGSDDGTFRVRRTGDTVVHNEPTGNNALVRTSISDEEIVARGSNAWDGVARFLSMRRLYGFPLTLVVGLSEEEQLSATSASARTYVWRAAIASVVILLFIALLWRASWKLAQTTRRENEAKLAHAERIQYLAYHDGLTALPNRALFSKMLEQGIHQARRYDRMLAVLFLDLDRFKQINDTLGHEAGDQLLQDVAARLQSCLRESDTVARFGGDEFVVLLPEFEDEKFLMTVAQKLLSVVSMPVAVRDQQLVCTTSIGVAVYPRDGQDEQTLMKCADVAMYHAKAEGKNNFQFYSKSLQGNSFKRLTLEASLRHALERGELEIHYQPKVSVETQQITGMEALLRWQSPEHGLVPPSEFIPIAEDTGLIGSIAGWALERACVQNVAWHNSGLPPVCVAVNLSARQFHDDRLLEDITHVLESTGIDPTLLELEITESMLMLNVEKGIRTLRALRDMQVRLAIDDFGTGYSSLSNLKRFPLNTLKIDRAFISALPNDAEDRVITQAIIGLGKALSMCVVAEGVETREQVQFLRERGCDQYQGYYFSKAVAATKFASLLAKQPHVGMSVVPFAREQAQPRIVIKS
jgi:diguanylate cyclase (GGDEF)-like protein